MNCEQAQNLISGQIDQEIAVADRALLDEHLQSCTACQASAESIRALDADLRRVFGFCEQSAVSVQERVLAQLRAETASAIAPAPVSPAKKNWAARAGWLVAVAASLLCGLLSWELYVQQPANRPGPEVAFFKPAPSPRGSATATAPAAPPPPRNELAEKEKSKI